MNVQQIIENKLNEQIDLSYLSVENESFRHAVPVDSETHFKVVVVSEQFQGVMLIKRHRLINEILKDELAGPIHALAMHTYTPQQWAEKSLSAPNSADCMGGGK